MYKRQVLLRGDLPNELCPAVLTSEGLQLAESYILLIACTHIPCDDQTEQVVARSARTAAFVWDTLRSTSVPSLLSSRNHAKRLAKDIFVDLLTSSCLNFEGLEGSIYTKKPRDVSNLFVDCLACHRGPPAKLADLCESIYKQTARGPPMTFSNAIRDDVPPALEGPRHSFAHEADMSVVGSVFEL